jgi:hypothetical protein
MNSRKKELLPSHDMIRSIISASSIYFRFMQHWISLDSTRVLVHSLTGSHSAQQITRVSLCLFISSINPLKINGSYMYSLLKQSITLHFVFMCFL